MSENFSTFAPISVQSVHIGYKYIEKNNGQMVNDQMVNIPDSHHGTLRAPVVLQRTEEQSSATNVYKILEDNHVIIIRNGERYDLNGKKLDR